MRLKNIGVSNALRTSIGIFVMISFIVSGATATLSSGVIGDVTGDGQVTIEDALFIAQYTVGTRTLTSTQLAAADVNEDGQVTIVDALFIAQYTVGLRQLPTPTPTPTATATATPTVTPSATPTATAIVTATATATATPTPTATATPTATSTPTSITAPPMDNTVATTIATSTEFLYTGSDPIQTGVTPGTIELMRAAVLRGRVLTREGTSLSGVNITILSHPEFGSTLTRSDGMFDMAVNGGGLLTVNYEKIGYLTATRQVNAPWQEYAWLPDVVMIQADPVVTDIDISSSAPIQVAQGSLVNDSDGIRQATLLFPQGVQANMTLPDGTTQSLTSMHVRATEYTVGDSGPEAMPAQLPKTSGYTYAVDLTVDEAMAKGASDVSFDKPVYTYVENFLNFPVGGIVPVGYYNSSLGQWIPSENGRIIKILGITGGMADLDVNGSNQKANASQLDALNITDAERQKIAGLYKSDQTLWRVPIVHFTPWDCNWPYGPPPDATSPNQPTPDQNDPPEDNSCKTSGSIIGCQDQVLGEAVEIAGTPLRLHYQSDRVPGRKEAYTMNISLSGASVPANLTGIDLEIFVAGRSFKYSFPAAPDQIQTFTWDGKDAYGRILQGSQPVDVRIGYVYPAVYLTPTQLGQAFGAFGDSITGNRARQEVIIWQEWKGKIGIWDARGQGLGGWSLNVHHAYDTSSSVLYLGDGRKRSAQSLGSFITTVAGNGSWGFGGDGGPAKQAGLSDPSGVAIGADGSLYIADSGSHIVRRVGPDGIITTVAGTGNSIGFSGDGGPAIQAELWSPTGVAIGGDGSLYIADMYNHRVRHVGSDGIITTVAGDGNYSGYGLSGDGGPAMQAGLSSPVGVAIGSDGSLYIADQGNNRVRRVGPDGIITTVAGNGSLDFSGDGGRAMQAQLHFPSGVSLGPDGSLYIGDQGNDRVRRVGPDGIINTVAGGGNYSGYGLIGDGGQATQARLSSPYGVATGSDGSLYIADNWNNRIRRVGPDGIITTVAGTGGYDGFSGDGGPATQAQLASPYGVAIGSEGSLYIVDYGNNRIRRVAPALPGLSLTDFLLPSEDGSELYIFNSSGRHLRTLDALTGALRYNFTYDSAGKLNAVIDSNGNMVTIERDAKGNATAIVSPYGQRTGLSLDAGGYLYRITDPAGDVHQFGYTTDGLLTRMTYPRGSIYRFSYDALGRLIKDEDPAGGFKTLERTEVLLPNRTGSGYSVRLSTGLNRNTSYSVLQLSTGDQRLANTFPDGLTTEMMVGTNGTQTITFPNGIHSTLVQGPDPRFGMQAPVPNNLTISTSSGLTQTVIKNIKATLTNPNDPLSLQFMNDSESINGRTFTTSFNATTKIRTSQTPLGRKIITTFDKNSRITENQVSSIVPTLFTYDARGRPSNTTQGIRTYSYSYDTQGNLANITDPLSHSVSFEYDAAGRMTKQTLEGGRQIQFTYDANGKVISIMPPGRPNHAFNYTPVDLIENYTPPDVGAGPTSTHYTYNPDRQLIQVTHPDGATINLGYDSAGRLSNITHPMGTTIMVYDSATGNLKNITAPDGGTMTYSYDGNLLTDTTWSGIISGSVHRTYNNNFSISSESVNGGNTVNFQYDMDGLLTQVGSLNLSRDPQNGMLLGSTLGSITETLGYNSFGEVVAHQVSFNDTGIFSVNYTRNDLGRIVQKNETIDGVIHIYNYTYDVAGRLTNVSMDDIMLSQYVYDSNGNRLNYTGPSGTISGMYDDQDRLMQYGETTYNYTGNGELLSKTNSSQTTTYIYDALGNVRNVTFPDGKKIEYVIDGQNRRIGKKVNGAMVKGFLWGNHLRIAAELDGNGNVISRFVYGIKINVPELIIKGGMTYRIITDHLGSVRLVVDFATGQIAQRIDFDAWGNVLNDTNPGFQPFGFAGGLYDPDTKLVRFGARDYESETGKWTRKEPRLFGGGTNLFSYALEDPINVVDRNGLDPTFEQCRQMAAQGFRKCMNSCSTLRNTICGMLGVFNHDSCMNACTKEYRWQENACRLIVPGLPLNPPDPDPSYYPGDPENYYWDWENVFV